MKIADIVTACDLRIGGGSEYGWRCYGPMARYIDFNADGQKGQDMVSAVFDPETLQVFDVSMGPNLEGRMFRWIDPEYREAHKKEEEQRGVVQAEDWEWVELDMEEDALQKASSLIRTGDCDPRVIVSVELDEEVLVVLMKEAHKQDITLNHLASNIIAEQIASLEMAASVLTPGKKEKKEKKEKKK